MTPSSTSYVIGLYPGGVCILFPSLSSDDGGLRNMRGSEGYEDAGSFGSLKFFTSPMILRQDLNRLIPFVADAAII